MSEATLTLLFTPRFGAVDRIQGLLRRRGFPVVGVNLERTHQEDVGRMTVTVSKPEALEQVARHLRKLPDVLEARVSESGTALCREYALIRLGCTPERQQEVRGLLDARSAWVVSATEDHLIIEATGSGAALDALFAALAPHNIEESARTNPIALARSA